jgi:GH43 family beta-xylosidase
MSSLFDGMLETFHDIGMEMHEGPGGVLAGTGVMLVWCAGYAAVSAAIGWLVAAVASAIVQTASWRKSQRRE